MTSIVDCAACAAVPSRTYVRESSGSESPSSRAELAEMRHLSMVLVMRRDVDQYDENHTRLYACPTCGTHYYYSRSEEEPHYPHNYGGEIRLYLRRLDPTSAIKLLEGIDTPEARALLAELHAREPALWASLERALESSNGQLRDHAACALLYHARGFAEVDARLLSHANPEVRVVAANLVLRVGDADTPETVCATMRAWLSKKAARQRVIDVLVELALANQGGFRFFDWGSLGTPSSYVDVTMRRAALAPLFYAAERSPARAQEVLAGVEAVAEHAPFAELIEKCRARKR